MGLKINVTLEALIPTDEYANIRVGMNAIDIDVSGDVEAQAEECLAAGIKVMRVLNNGLQEEVAGMLVDSDQDPTALREMIKGYDERLGKFESVLGRIIGKVKSLVDIVEKRSEADKEALALKKAQARIKKAKKGASNES